jgi:molecular chaperone HtpG
VSLRRALAASGQAVPQSSPVLELNVSHPLARYLDSLQNQQEFGELALLLYDQAGLNESGHVADPADYGRRLNKLLLRLVTPSAA